MRPWQSADDSGFRLWRQHEPRSFRPADYHAHRLLRAIAENTTLSRLRADQCCAPSHWLMPVTALERYFPHVPEALTNTHRIAEQCYTDWDFKETIFPSFRQLSPQAAFETLREKTYEGALGAMASCLSG